MGGLIRCTMKRVGENKVAKAGSARLVRAVPALASLLLPFLPLVGGDISITEKTTVAAA